ncbi:MAG: glycosyltransferase family 39 protein [Verrucomicrobiota bacterium]|jgi:4-amino-4-deoxy-L-arabinose transferase-like glycosyltransferase
MNERHSAKSISPPDKTASSDEGSKKPSGLSRKFYKPLFIVLFGLAVVVRALLCWVNPPTNSFDDHFQPIFMIIKSGIIPAKNACFQCYHPPVFYWISAMIGKLALHAGVSWPQMIKLLQFVCCFYGILTVGICYMILKKFPLSNFSRLLAFGTVCFLPRHIYMSAMNSNDTISYLFVALSIYLVIIAWERELSPWSLGALSVVLSITLFTKYTAFVVIPTVLTPFTMAFLKRLVIPRKKVLISAISILVLPMSLLTAYMLSNVKHYQSPLPWNVTIFDPSHRPRDAGGISFFTFKPWEDIKTPMLAPGKLHSFWTLIYSGMWFDTEPYFLRFLDSNDNWWKRYYGWYGREENYPDENPPFSDLTILEASGLITLGLFPLFLMLIGFCYCVKYPILGGGLVQTTPTERIGFGMFPILVLFNAAGIIALTLRLPVYSSMKPSYFLGAMPAFMIFLSLGIMPCERNETIKRVILVTFGALFTLAIIHILHIVFAIRCTQL